MENEPCFSIKEYLPKRETILRIRHLNNGNTQYSLRDKNTNEIIFNYTVNENE